MTGATSGFGIDWFKSVSQDDNTSVFILARDELKFNQLLLTIPMITRTNIQFVYCELSSLSSIVNAIKHVKTMVASVDVLINNAGIFPNDNPCFNDDDIELTFVVNHLAPLLITLLLKDKLILSDSPKVINTSSFQHFNAKLTLDDMSFKRSKFNAMLAYRNSKLCITLSTLYSEHFISPNITVCCFDPGIVDTNMTKDAIPTFLNWAYPTIRRFFRDGVKGAQTGIHLTNIQNDRIVPGSYYRDMVIKEPSKDAQSLLIAERLHKVSMALLEPYL